MNHSEMDELYELYLLGALESEQAAEMSEHLRTGCEQCAVRISEASALLASLAALAEPATPPAHLRERVLAVASPAKSKQAAWPRAFALAAAACLGLLFWGVAEYSTIGGLRLDLQDLRQQRNELRAAVEILSRPDTRTVNFGKSESDPHGRLFLSGTGGGVFVGSHLPALAKGKTFELWLVPAKGNPQAAGLFGGNRQAVSVNVLSQSFNLRDFAAVAISVEPAGGSPQPTTKPFLIVPLA